MADMTPTEKDAMALAVVRSPNAQFASIADAQRHYDSCAYLAARVAELEAERDKANERAARTAAQYQHEFEAHGQTIERAERAEAELAAVREDAKDAQHVIWLLLRSNGGALTISAQAARELDPGQAAIERTNAPSGEVALRAIDAARGGE